MNKGNAGINVPAIGSIAGWATLAVIIAGSIIGPQVIAGPRVSGTLDAATIQAYYSHTALAPLNSGESIFVFFFLPFVLALREVLSVNPRARFLATLGLAFAIAGVPLYLIAAALQATLITVATRGGDILPLFRFWDILYNSATYALEAGYASTFALAMRDMPAFPHWMPRFGIIVGILQLVNMSALFIGIPDNLTLVGNLAFMVWFIGANVGLGRIAKTTVRAT